MIDDAERPAPTAAERKRFFKALALVLGLTAFVWAGYGMARPHYHPHAGHPVFDAAYYVDWSDSILSEDDTDPRFRGAFYRAPLYPLLLSLLRGPIGVGLSAVVWLQMLAALAATGWLAHYAFRWAGPTAGIGTAVLLGAYHPWLFFSSWLLAECCALVLLVVALHWIARRGVGWTILAGVSAGLATLARPNLLLVVLGWAAWAAYRGDRGKALVLLFATAVTVLPVTVVNGQRSGHFVPISANGGLTLYHGNGPGAEGVFRQAARISSNPSAQRQAATAAASRRSGLEMDAVDADRYWGRQAVRERLSAPLGTLVLVLKRLVLLLGTSEIALNETPAIDPNPWSRATFVPFAVLVALAAVAAVARRRHDVAAWSWIAIVACAATPLIFYVSSRGRRPGRTLRVAQTRDQRCARRVPALVERAVDRRTCEAGLGAGFPMVARGAGTGLRATRPGFPEPCLGCIVADPTRALECVRTPVHRGWTTFRLRFTGTAVHRGTDRHGRGENRRRRGRLACSLECPDGFGRFARHRRSQPFRDLDRRWPGIRSRRPFE